MLLDGLDGDADLEPNHGYAHAYSMMGQTAWMLMGNDDEREAVSEDEAAQCEGEGEDADAEGDLGWATFGDQSEVKDPLTIPDAACYGSNVADLDQRRAAYQARGGRYTNVTACDDVVDLGGGKVRVKVNLA